MKKIAKHRGAALIIIGIVLIIGAASLTAYNLWENYQAESVSEKIMAELDKTRFEIIQQKKEIEQVEQKPDPFAEIDEPDPNRDMPTIEIDGHEYIGSLTIPPLEVEFPVTADWSYDLMRIATCRYSGTVYLDNLVICAHNYDNFFRKLDKLQKDDEIVFTDVEGNKYKYRVIETEVLQPTAVEEMTTGSWDLTLFTCNYWGNVRVAVRCERYDK